MCTKINGEGVIIALTSLVVLMGVFVIIFAAMVANQDKQLDATKAMCSIKAKN